MDLRIYYQKIRDASSKIADAFPVVVSNETPDGGKVGVLTEVTRPIAAKMVVEGLARLADDKEAAAFRQKLADARRQAEESVAAAKVQVAVLNAEELRTLRELSPAPVGAKGNR